MDSGPHSDFSSPPDQALTDECLVKKRAGFFSVGFLRRREGPSPAGKACDFLLSRLS
ncbi:hypothetical protein ACHZIB_001283 [Yersinia enterocolitica]